jgi:hypothetical protein
MEAKPMAIVAITSIRLNSILYLPAFWWHAVRSYRACMATDGVMATQLAPKRFTYSTMTQWRDKSAMLAFINHPHHVKAMRWSKGKTLGKVYHYESDALPSWAEAYDMLERLGRVAH